MLCLTENEENEKQVLILRRGKTAPYQPGKWSLPGGNTDPDESAVQTVVRELQEETGLVAHDAKELGKPYASPKDPTYGMAAVVCYCQNELDLGLSSDWPGGLPISKKLGFPENDAFEWVTIDQAFSAKFEQCSTANLALIAHVLSKEQWPRR
jgi:8-oxo-dGTP pyrophosphatase MutT (NUDIX family)